MNILSSVLIAFSMFSALPVPQIEWTEKNMRLSLCAFPLVGLLIGFLMWGWSELSMFFALPDVLRGAGLTLIPILVTGGIHLDGYADTSDAIASHADVARRQEILKDPHLGAFAAIRLGVYLIASFAVLTALQERRLVMFLCIFTLSRALSALALFSFPLREGSGLARTFASAGDRRGARIFLAALSAALSAVLLLAGFWAAVPAAALVFFLYRRMAEKDFGGTSGDLAGWFLQKAELWMFAAVCFWQFLEKLI